MSKIIYPGRHPSFDITQFSPKAQRSLRKLEEVFHLNRHGKIKIGATSEYTYAFLRPTQIVSNLLHTDKEILVLFSDYSDYQSRTIDAYDHIYDLHEDHRADRVVRFLVSEDDQVASKCRTWLSDNPAAPVIIPFYFGDLHLASKLEELFARIRSFIYSRDLFSLNSPLRSELYFFGRGQLINEIAAKLASSENFGLFGLRRSGKTSILFGVQRALNARKIRSVIFDCSSPSIHRKRWFQLLQDIVEGFWTEYAPTIRLEVGDRYSDAEASKSFAVDMHKLSKHHNNCRFVILFDEIERISLGSASSPHWNGEEDPLFFWQSVRAAFQSSASCFSFLIVGTNPSAIEIRKIGNTDNPLWGNVEKRYIPMFTFEQTKEMVTSIGSIMGLTFPDPVISRLQDDYGGHPYLTRYACSYVAGISPVRPLQIDRTLYDQGSDRYNSESDEYINSMVEFLKETFQQEFDILKILALGDYPTFSYFADADPVSVDHLRGYGLVEKGHVNFFFRIGIAERYFARHARPSVLMSEEEKRTELSLSRNSLEIAMRRMVRIVFKSNFTEEKSISLLLASVNESRRSGLQGKSVAALLSDEGSPLFLKELDQIIQKSWNLFERALAPLDKNDFVYHVKTVNISRPDAHAANIEVDNLEKARISLNELSKRVNEFLD